MSKVGDERDTEPQDEDVNALVAAAKAGQQGAMEALIRRYKGAVTNVAKRYCGSRAKFEDLVAAGNTGLWKALAGFNPDLGYAFWTYAKRSVNSEILNELRARSGAPPSLAKVIRKISDAEEMLSQDLGREPTLEEVFKKVLFGDPFYEPPTEEYATRLSNEMRKLKQAYDFWQSSAWQPPPDEEGESQTSHDWIEKNVPDPMLVDPLLRLCEMERRRLKREILTIMQRANPPTYAATWDGRKAVEVALEFGISAQALNKRVERWKKSLGLHFGDGGPAHRIASPPVRGCAYHDMCCQIERLLGEGYNFLEVMRGG